MAPTLGGGYEDMMKILPQRWLVRSNASAERRAAAVRQREATKAFYRRFIEAGDLCFDVGANLGNRTAIQLELGDRVIAIEPQPACVKNILQ